MTTFDAAALLHIVGYVTGASLYGMLLAMVVRGRGPAHRQMVGAGWLGLVWNLGELSAHLAEGAGLVVVGDWLSALSYRLLAHSFLLPHRSVIPFAGQLHTTSETRNP